MSLNNIFGVIHPPPKPSFVYKCKNCGKKIKLIYGLLFKKQCPCCGSHDVKLSIGLVEESSCPFVH
jgi:rRNA maturation endonuclease Nob1